MPPPTGTFSLEREGDGYRLRIWNRDSPIADSVWLPMEEVIRLVREMNQIAVREFEKAFAK